MKPNVGSIDKNIRLVLGVAMIGAGIYLENWWGALGIVPLATALMNTCPAYSILGLSTSSDKEKV